MADQTSFAFPTPPVPSLGSEQLADSVRSLVARDMAVESIQTPRDPARQGLLILRGRLLRPSHVVFPAWLQELGRLGYTPLLRPASEKNDEDVALHVLPGIARRSKPRTWINVVLFLATVVSTLFVGSLYGDTGIQAETFAELFLPRNLIKGWPFASVLLAILTAHEFGHYFAARYHNVAVTLPYFIPVPLPGGFGTLGAFIQLREPVPDRRKLFDIGIAGPLAGFVLALPLLMIGLSTSPVQTLPPPPYMIEGNSILYYLMKYLIFGQALPNPITNQDVMMNQVTYAAWTGLLVTALNLLPVGQLDGGHTVYALFGRGARYINIATTVILGILAIAGLEPLQRMYPALTSIGFNGWFVWLGLIFFLIGPFHPPALDDVTSLDNRRRWLGYFVIFLFIITFPPVPLRLVF